MATAIALPRQPHSNWLARLRTIQLGIGARGAVGHGLARQRGGAMGNGLLNNLIAYWPLNEASGDALDAHTNALTLTDTNTVTSKAGKVYALARQYTAVNSEYHTRSGDDALLSVGDVDNTIAAWVYLDSKPASGIARHIAGKGQPNNEWALYFYTEGTGGDYWVYGVRNTGNSASGYVSQNVAPVGLAEWNFLVVWHDSTANTINLQVNNGAVNTTSWSGGVRDGVTAFTIGRIVNALPWDGRIGPIVFWKSAAGGGGVLTAAQRTALYNSGAGLAYAAFTT